MIRIKVTGLNEIIQKFQKLSEKDMYEDVINETADIAYKLAHDRYVPVDTGALRDSIYLEKERNSFTLGARIRYAIYNEYGSMFTPLGPAKKQGFRPFIRPSIYEATRRMPKIFSQKIDEIFK